MTVLTSNNVAARKEAVQWKQTLAGLVDVVLVISLVTGLLIYRYPTAIYHVISQENSTLLVFICFILYRLASLLLFNATLGMKLMRIELLNGEEQRLSIFEKMLAAFFILYKGVAYYRK